MGFLQKNQSKEYGFDKGRRENYNSAKYWPIFNLKPLVES